MTDLEYIKNFSKITIKSICDKNHINSSNLWAGRIDNEKLAIVKKTIESEVAKLYIEDNNDK